MGILQSMLKRPDTLAFQRGCDLGFPPACDNLNRPRAGGDSLARGGPRVEDLPILLRGTRAPLRERTPEKLYGLACEQGWPGTCGDLRRARPVRSR